MNERRKAAHKTGMKAENWAAWHLRLRGYKILQRRFKCRAGEIDLIALKKSAKRSTVIAVEVKYRKDIGRDGFEAVLETIRPQSQQRIARALHYFVSLYPHYVDHDLRMDAMVVGSPLRIYHLDNAWQARS